MSLIGIAITVYIYRTDARDVITKTMAESLENYKRGEHEGVTLTWDKIQKEFECCGVNNSTDWEGTPAFNETNDVPDFCCKNITMGCGKGASDRKKSQSQCRHSHTSWLKNYQKNVKKMS